MKISIKVLAIPVKNDYALLVDLSYTNDLSQK